MIVWIFSALQFSDGVGEDEDTVTCVGTSIWVSLRSSSGPEIRFWCLATVPGEQVQALTGSPKKPHGQAWSAI